MDIMILSVLCALVVAVSIYAVIDNYFRTKERYEYMNNKSIFENCVFCNKELHIRKDLDITHRLYYIEGAGQLCKECYDSTYP